MADAAAAVLVLAGESDAVVAGARERAEDGMVTAAAAAAVRGVEVATAGVWVEGDVVAAAAAAAAGLAAAEMAVLSLASCFSFIRASSSFRFSNERPAPGCSPMVTLGDEWRRVSTSALVMLPIACPFSEVMRSPGRIFPDCSAAPPARISVTVMVRRS